MTASEPEWDGVCACGKAEMDGKRCALGATHRRETQNKEADSASIVCFSGAAPSMEDLLA